MLLIFEWLQVMVMGTGTWQIGVAIVSVDIVSQFKLISVTNFGNVKISYTK